MRTTQLFIKDRSYDLRLTIENTIKLQKKLNKSPLEVFTRLEKNETPSMEELATIIYYALQPQHFDEFKSIPSVYALLDEYFDDNDITDLIKFVIEVYKDSGIIPRGADLKNAQPEK